ncbi:MAG: restriction endonuclease subunit S [Actinobacteria bacterium]|nr:restriction endonuclease subunit S [Actinomycetota bacterium]
MSTYKPSKAPWLARIPSTWSEAPLFTFFRDNKTKNIGMAEANVLSLSYGTIKRRDLDSGMGLLPESFETYQIVEPGDIVMRLTDLQNDQRSLRTGLVRERGIVTSAYLALRPSKYVDPRFAHYLLHSLDTMKVYYGLGAGVRQTMKYRDLSGAYLAMPMRVVQTQIADYLDSEIARIDALIDRKQRFIDLLLEKRTAIIAHAVTKGFDYKAEMKDSGIEWFGAIPLHWTVGRLKDLVTSIQTGPFGTQLGANDYMVDGTPVINPVHIKDNRLVPDPETSVTEATVARLNGYLLRTADVVCARRGDLGRCAVVTPQQEGWVTGTGSLRVRPNQRRVAPEFLQLLISQQGSRDWLSLQSVGATMDNLNEGILARLPVAAPDVVEQRSIIRRIGADVCKVDDLVERTRRSIDLLREYRTALISAAVTGQIDIPGTET